MYMVKWISFWTGRYTVETELTLEELNELIDNVDGWIYVHTNRWC